MKDQLIRLFSILNTRAVIVLLLLLVIVIGYFELVSKLVVLLLLLVAASFSKVYHRFFRSSIGIDLVFITGIMVALAYKNLLVSVLLGWTALILADWIGSRLSHTSMVSMIGLTVVIVLAPAISGMGIIAASIVCLLIYNLLAAILYYVLGSSPGRIVLFTASHLVFNLLLILNIEEKIMMLM